MFDQRDDPDHLLHSLESFLRLWHGFPPNWYGIAPEKLAQAAIPYPLRRLYAFAGHWPGANLWYSAFGHQDCLAPFELIEASDGRLIFAWENQGVWSCSTTPEGKDPPVWVRIDDAAWQPLCNSLTQFLVTLCLHETVFGAEHLGSAKSVTQSLKEAGMHVTPLWLEGPYVSSSRDQPLAPLSFHVADGGLLVLNDYWCGTNNAEVALSRPELFKPRRQKLTTVEPFWEDPIIPAFVRKHHLEFLARQHEEQAQFHSKRARGYRRSVEAIVE